MQPSLAAQFKDLQADVGFFLGYGRGADFGFEEWDDEQQAAITRSVKGGLRNFYHCGYDWSFLKPVATLTLTSGAQTVPLPDDFGGIEGRLTVTVAGSSGHVPIPLMGDVRPFYAATPDMVGRPQRACIDPQRGTDATRGQRFDLFVFPQADQDYTLQFAYYVNPNYLTGAFPYAYGGAQHAETLLESCLAVAEKILDDQATIHAMEFKERLAVSMHLDRRNKPQHLGYNGDRSDLVEGGRSQWHGRQFIGDTNVVTFDGVTSS